MTFLSGILARTAAVALVPLLALSVTAPAADAATPVPSGLAAASRTATTLSFDWNDVADAPRYRIQLSTASSMKNATYHRFYASEGTVSGLKPATTYYAKVRVITDSGSNLSAYSTAIKTSSLAVAVPADLAVQAPQSTEVFASWQPSEGAAAYEVQTSTSSSMSSPSSNRVTTASATVPKRKASTPYYVRVRVVTTSGSAVTGWTATRSVTTPDAPPTGSGSPDLRVGSYNLFGMNNDGSSSGDKKPWSTRKPVVVSQILAEKSDVVGLQEAYQGGGDPQYDQLRDSLQTEGGSYEVVDTDTRTSKATRILYKSTTLTPGEHGYVQYASQVSGKTPRFLVWSVFTQKSTGKRFFFANTHLAPESQTIKVEQWREMISKIKQLNTANLPVVSVGDFNTTKFNSKYEAAPREVLPAMKNAGFGDVMNQEFKVNPPRNPRAEKVVNGWINSFNGFRRDIRAYSYPDRRDKVGNGVDWVFATNSLRVKEWKVVIDLDESTLKIRGVIPSDHLMITSVLTL